MNLKNKQAVTKNFDACGRLCQITSRYLSYISSFFSATLVEKS